MNIAGQQTIDCSDAEMLSDLCVEGALPGPVYNHCCRREWENARKRYLRALRKISGCKYATTHMVTSCGASYTLVYGRD